MASYSAAGGSAGVGAGWTTGAADVTSGVAAGWTTGAAGVGAGWTTGAAGVGAGWTTGAAREDASSSPVVSLMFFQQNSASLLSDVNYMVSLKGNLCSNTK